MKKITTLIILILLITISVSLVTSCEKIFNLKPQNINNNNNKEQILYENSSSPLLYFCPNTNCTKVFIKSFDLAEDSIYCTLYNLKKKELLNSLEKKINNGINVGIVVEENTYKDYTYDNYPLLKDVVITDSNFALMHNKYIRTQSL